MSTGPRTAAGKARSRANAVKHGLTGAGVALPAEDDAAVRALCAEIQEEWGPGTRFGAELAHDVALLTVRKHRARDAQAAWLRARVRRAGADFDRARADQADRLLDAIEDHPRPYRRALLALPEGVDRLVGALEELLDDLLGAAPTWSEAHHRRLDALFGYRPADLPRNRPTRFSKALLGDFEAIGDAELAVIPAGETRGAWAVGRLAEAVAAEVARLREHRAGLDHAGLAQDRLDAIAGAQFDTSHDAELARRYELAAARELSRTLRDFPRAEALGQAGPPAAAEVAAQAPVTAAAEVAPSPPPPIDAPPPPDLSASFNSKAQSDNEMGVPLASFGTGAVAGSAAAGSPPPAPRRPVPTVAFTPPRAPHGR